MPAGGEGGCLGGLGGGLEDGADAWILALPDRIVYYPAMSSLLGIDELFGTKARVRLLRRLARESQPMSARQLGELTGITHPAVAAALEPLVAEGIVTRRSAGPSYQYALQREHVVVETVLLPALAAEEATADLMAAELVGLLSADAVSVVLFGSAARGEHAAGSDVDVLVIAADSRTCIRIEQTAEEQRGRFFRRFGRPLSVHCIARGDLAGRVPPFVKAAAAEGVLLHGKDLRELGVRVA